jgi:hypothetical protein
VLYLAIPAQNEAATIGLLLWRLRTVLAEFPREYEAVVYDDASSDNTSEILASYAKVMPLTVLRGETPLGYAGAVNALARYVSRQTRYPRRDAMLLLQGDFTDPPALVPEFVKRFEGGADLVIGERTGPALAKAPVPVRRMQRATSWLLRLLVSAQGVRDLTGSYRLVRISVLRDLIRNVGDAPVLAGDSQSANADFLLHLIPLARRVETLEVDPTWGIRLRDTRRVAMRDGMALARWAWTARGRKAVASTAPDTGSDAPRAARPARGERDPSNVLPFEAVDSMRGAHGRPATPAAPPRKPRPPRPTPAAIDSAPTRSALDDDGDAVDTLSATGRAKPRRKRSRGGRRDESGVLESAAGGTLPEELAASVERPDGPRARRDPSLPPGPQRNEGKASAEVLTETEPRPAGGLDSQAGEGSLHPETSEFSPVLSKAVDDAETSFDNEVAGRPPKKRRRRRGAKHRGTVADGIDGDEARSDPSADHRDAGDMDGPYRDERNEPSASGNLGPDASGGASRVSEHDDESLDAEGLSGDDASGTGDESRARRRGRRGRRGGARRRGARTDGGDGSADTGDTTTPPESAGGGDAQ